MFSSSNFEKIDNFRKTNYILQYLTSLLNGKSFRKSVSFYYSTTQFHEKEIFTLKNREIIVNKMATKLFQKYEKRIFVAMNVKDKRITG